ncbi:MAG TPA: hypothetical protein PK852_02710 [Mesotoga prima]|uniref:hypothetical protein n=1 Tax=Mesotoga prima TaxID=1184387 RepID=UPI002C32023F|nr:hypothetical protein [Mesotoga prima]HPE53007.1 hypothetical protein [Mesotoga prima]
MGYNLKQYSAALDFVSGGDANVTNSDDKRRIQAYDLYENLYINSSQTLKITLRGDDSYPILMPSGKKIIEATNRFLGVGLNYFVEGQGDNGTQQQLDYWFGTFFKREAIRSKFASSKRWGLVRGDGCFYLYGSPEKLPGSRLSLVELDPRQLFEIEDANGKVVGVHIVDTVQDFREPDKEDKKVARRRTFRLVLPEGGSESVGVTSELKFFEIGKWDDRTVKSAEKIEAVPNPGVDEEPYQLPPSITQLPVYKWRNNPPQNSTWGHSQLTGLETLLYAINQSLTDEDATMVFQGLGMYVTNAAPPQDEAGNTTDWNIGPMQIIEIGTDQEFTRVTGVSDVTPYQNHMTFIDEKGLSEASGTPEIAIGRVDVSVAESGISLQLQLMPLLAQNAEKEEELVSVLDQMFHDLTTMWLPAYEPEMFPSWEAMQEMSVVTIFDDPMPKNRDAQVQETLLLVTSNLILTSMAVAKLRSLGWNYPTVDINGNPLNDDDIAAMLNEQASANAVAQDPFSAQYLGGDSGGGFEDQGVSEQDQQTIDLGSS